jgi:hypothetical protein
MTPRRSFTVTVLPSSEMSGSDAAMSGSGSAVSAGG